MSNSFVREGVKREMEVAARPRRRLAGALLFVALLIAAFARPLLALVQHALAHELHSHILLVPVVSAYLVFDKRGQLPGAGPAWWAGTVIAAFLGIGFLLFRFVAAGHLSINDGLAATVAAFLAFLLCGACLFLGKALLKELVFPACFLLFMIPLPDGAVQAIEHGLVLASAWMTNLFFLISGVPYLRMDYVTFELPQLGAIRIAQECSGIRSTWVLFITSLLMSYVFLRSPWRRAVLVGLVVPLGVLRNAFRILVIVLLSVYVDPAIIDGPIHRQGGPVFFALSLVPLFALLWWFRRGERGAGAQQSVGNG